MAHLLYELEGTTHRRLDKITLTSKDGPIATFVREVRGQEPGGWHMSEDKLLDWFGGTPNSHAAIVDLKPNAEGIVNLYRLRGIIGFSHNDWTPICFLLEEMFADEPNADPGSFKQEFTFSGFQRKAISYVYLRRGTQGGAAWNWGHVGRVNGAVLFPEAWQYFTEELDSSGWLTLDRHQLT